MIVLGIDPGNKLSALVWYDTVAAVVINKMKIPNEEALGYLRQPADPAKHLAIEMAESFGAKVWGQVFETVWWTGRFCEAWNRPLTRIVRREVKMHLTGSAKAKDGQIRNCLIERWGGEAIALARPRAAKARTTRAAAVPAVTAGPLFGVAADVWQALAIAVTWSDLHASASTAWRSAAA